MSPRDCSFDVGEVFAALQPPDTHYPRRGECRVHVELFFFEVAVSQRDFADLKSDPSCLERTHQGVIVDVWVLGVLGAVHQEIHSVGMSHNRNLGVGGHIQVVAYVAQAFGGLGRRIVDVVNNPVLGDGEAAQQDGGCKNKQHLKNPFCVHFLPLFIKNNLLKIISL